MKESVFSAIILTFALTIFCEGQSNSWNGVTPLLSTRADVEKLFGSLTNCESGSCTIKTSKEVVSFGFALGDCKEGWNIPKDTVLGLTVVPNSDVGKSFDELKLDRTGFTLSVDDVFSAIWTNAAKGLQYSFSNVEREFRAAFYIPKKSDNNLRCDGFPAFTPEGSHYTSDRFHFNKYGNPKISLNWVYAHLDNLTANLTAQNLDGSDGYRGYILVYFDAKHSFKKYKS
ncbi:MAG: hypothetical protein H7Z37_16120, partial [Pyrinomonadaceae bacterium]|nr:hypothetical protein [Pyrinomonadaceae bacterium]